MSAAVFSVRAQNSVAALVSQTERSGGLALWVPAGLGESTEHRFAWPEDPARSAFCFGCRDAARNWTTIGAFGWRNRWKRGSSAEKRVAQARFSVRQEIATVYCSGFIAPFIALHFSSVLTAVTKAERSLTGTNAGRPVEKRFGNCLRYSWRFLSLQRHQTALIATTRRNMKRIPPFVVTLINGGRI